MGIDPWRWIDSRSDLAPLQAVLQKNKPNSVFSSYPLRIMVGPKKGPFQLSPWTCSWTLVYNRIL